MNDLRIAWLLPTAWFYWQPSISELSKIFANTKVFAGLFPGFAKGFENSLEVEVVGERKVIAVKESKESYGDNFTYLSPSIVPKLLKYRPQVVFSSSFGVWSLLALAFKGLGRWKVVIAYEGSSPGVDYRNSPMRLMLRRLMVWLSDACISNSEAGRSYLIEVLNAPADRTFRQPYEVPDVRSLSTVNPTLEKVSPTSPLSFSDLNRPVFVFVGSLVTRKGVRCLIEACQKLKAAGLDNFTVLLIGDGDERTELEDLTRSQQLDSTVIWVGRVDYTDIGTYFHHSDVFVLPTLEDTWGMVVLEAMLLGKPVICSTGAGASELVEEGKNGYQFPPGEATKLAEAMTAFIKHPDQVNPMGQKARETLERYSPQAAAQFMADIISKIT